MNVAFKSAKNIENSFIQVSIKITPRQLKRQIYNAILTKNRFMFKSKKKEKKGLL